MADRKDPSQQTNNLSLTGPNIFDEGAMINRDTLTRDTYLVAHGIISSGGAFAYNVETPEEKEKDEERKAQQEDLVKASFEAANEAANDALFGYDEPTHTTVSNVKDEFGADLYTDLTITNANGDYLGGECKAPWATASTSASGASTEISTGSFAAVAVPEDASRGIASASFAGVASGAYVAPSLTPTMAQTPVYMMSDADRANASFAELSGTADAAPFSPFTSTLDTKPDGLKTAPLSVFQPKPPGNELNFQLAM